VERQLATMPHVMFGGLVHEQALTLARRLAGRLWGTTRRSGSTTALRSTVSPAIWPLPQLIYCAPIPPLRT